MLQVALLLMKIDIQKWFYWYSDFKINVPVILFIYS